MHAREDSGDDAGEGDSLTGSDPDFPALTGTIHGLPGHARLAWVARWQMRAGA